MITFDGVCKRYGRRDVLRDFGARVQVGAITALVGPNGAGKTTLIKLLLGLVHADRGTIRINGKLLDGNPDYRGLIGWMPQIAHFPAHQSGRQLLETMAKLRGAVQPAELSLLDSLGLGDQVDRPLGELSGGTRQKVNAVLALAFRPTLLVLDEPTAGLDPLAARVFKDRLISERTRGTTVLITSHVLSELEDFADHVLFLADGRAQWHGDIASLKRSTGTTTIERAVARLLGGHQVTVAA